MCLDVRRSAAVILISGLLLACSLGNGWSSQATSIATPRLDLQTPAWERLYGPPGGYIDTIAFDPSDPEILYAAGSRDGLFKSTDAGATWQLLPDTDPEHGRGNLLMVDPENPQTVYGPVHGFARSDDGGRSWTSLLHRLPEAIAPMDAALHPSESGTVYLAGALHDRRGCAVFKSTDRGNTWTTISPRSVPFRCGVGGLAVQDSGQLWLGVNDEEFSAWEQGRLLTSRDEGRTWESVDYGSIEPRFIWSVFANPWDPTEIWVSEGPLHNEGIEQPLLFRSQDGGESWRSVRISARRWDSTQVRVIGASPDGDVYAGAGGELLVAEAGAERFRTITPPSNRMTGVDFTDVAIHPDDTDVLYLPLRSSGIAYSADKGRTWERRDSGISTISVNLIETDPVRPGTVYASSLNGQGFFRSDDYGETWTSSLDGIVHPFGDEIDPDPHREGVVWFIADVPYTYRSTDFGDSWEVQMDPRRGGGFNFESVYALAQGSSSDRIYVLDNGFGIFRGENPGSRGNWDWRFLRQSEVDYSYTLAVDPTDDEVIYSGYSRKPFQEATMIRASRDAGETWETVLQIEGGDGVTSIDIDDANTDRVFAASTSAQGGAVWRSVDGGRTWVEPNPTFNFTTVHEFAQAPSDPQVVYAGVWGGGTFRTRDGGRTWDELPAPEAFSAAGIAVDPADPDTIYLADRATSVLYRSRDGGATFAGVFDAGERYSRLMDVTLDPSDPDRLYTIAMERPTAMDRAPGREGAVFRVEEGQAEEITGDLPRMPLSLTVDPHDPTTLYAILHGYGVYASTNRGQTWNELSTDDSGLPKIGFTSLYVDPRNAEHLYLVGGCDVRFESISSAGLDPDVVNGIYHSLDGGESWTRLNGDALGATSGPVKSLAFAPNDPDLLLAAAANGLYISRDRGEHWTRDSRLPYDALGGAVLTRDSVVALTNGAGVFHGAFWGQGEIDWTPESAVNAQVHFSQVLVDPANTGTIYASAYPGGVFKSVDDGATWQEANFGLPSFAVEDPLHQGYYALALAPSDADVLYLGLYGRGVYKSVDGAGTWMPMNGQDGTMLGQYVTDLAVAPDDADHVFLGSEDGVWETRDGGRSWANVTRNLPTTDVKTIALTPAREVYVGTRGYGLFRLRPGGRWQPQAPVGQWGVVWPIWDDRPRYQYSDILFHPSDDQRMLFGSFPAGIYASDDGGDTWRESNLGWTLDGVFSLVAHPENPETVYAGTYNGVNRSLDFGEHWEMWDNGWPDEQWVFTIAFDPRDPDVMYACSKNGENEGTGTEDFHGTVMKSLNGGESWFEITDGLPLDQEYYDLIVNPHDPDVIFLASQHDGMFISHDAGESWEPWNQGLDGKIPATNGNNVTRVLAISSDHQYLYYGADGAGVFRRAIGPDTSGDEPGSGDETDSDGDGVPDDEDYCPDYPGDPAANGC